MPGQSKQRAVIDSETRIAALIDIENAVRAMLGNEGAGNDEVLAAGSREPGDIPTRMIDGAVADRHEESAVFRGAFADGGYMTAEQGPLAMIHAT
jgi:hypothetical protein